MVTNYKLFMFRNKLFCSNNILKFYHFSEYEGNVIHRRKQVSIRCSGGDVNEYICTEHIPTGGGKSHIFCYNGSTTVALTTTSNQG